MNTRDLFLLRLVGFCAPLLCLSSAGAVVPDPADVVRPADNWAYHDLGDQTHCLYQSSGNASVLYRPAPLGSTSLLIYLSGGGSCNSANTCMGLSDPNSVPKNVDGYPADPNFLQESKLEDNLYLRVNQPAAPDTRINPFVNMNMAMIPYCTGDSHSGEKVRYWE